MLDTHYCIKEIENIKDFFTVCYVLIDDIYQEYIDIRVKQRRNIHQAILTDSEIITIGLVGELMGIDSEKAWFSYVDRNFKDLFPRLCDRTRFNRTKRGLLLTMKEIYQRLRKIMDIQYERFRIIDSAPVPVYEFGRAHFCAAFKEKGAYGYCPSPILVSSSTLLLHLMAISQTMNSQLRTKMTGRQFGI